MKKPVKKWLKEILKKKKSHRICELDNWLNINNIILIIVTIQTHQTVYQKYNLSYTLFQTEQLCWRKAGYSKISQFAFLCVFFMLIKYISYISAFTTSSSTPVLIISLWYPPHTHRHNSWMNTNTWSLYSTCSLPLSPSILHASILKGKSHGLFSDSLRWSLH